MIQPGFNIVVVFGGRGNGVSVVATVNSFKLYLETRRSPVSSIFLNIFFKIVDVLLLSQLYNYFD